MAEITSTVGSIEHTPSPDADKGMPSPTLSGTSAVRRNAAPLDGLAVTTQQMKAWGIPYNKETGEANVGLAWVRNGESNVYRDAPEDRRMELEHVYEGSSAVMHKGKVISRHDVILWQYDKQYDVERQADVDAESRKFEYGLNPVPGNESPGALEGHYDFDASGEPYDHLSTQDQKIKMSQMSRYHRESGMIGPTKGLSLANAIESVGGPQAARAESEMWRRGAAHTEISQEQFGSMFADRAPTSKAVRNFHGMGDTGLGKSTQQKVAANSAAGRRAAALAASAARR